MYILKQLHFSISTNILSLLLQTHKHNYTYTLGKDWSPWQPCLCALHSLRVRWCSVARLRGGCLCGRTGVQIETPWGYYTNGTVSWRAAERGHVAVWPSALAERQFSWLMVKPGSRSWTGEQVCHGISILCVSEIREKKWKREDRVPVSLERVEIQEHLHNPST